MEFKNQTVLLIVLLAVLQLGAALKCYQGVPGVSETQVTCAGSCIITETMQNDKKLVAVACMETAQKDGCTEAGGSKVCYCNKDLCNKGDGGNTPKPSGTSGLRAHTIPIVTCLSVFIAKLFYF